MTMTLRRRFLAWLRGPLCDAGTAAGEGCLRTALYTSLPHPPGWSRGLRWCEEHKGEAASARGYQPRPASPGPVKPPPRTP